MTNDDDIRRRPQPWHLVAFCRSRLSFQGLILGFGKEKMSTKRKRGCFRSFGESVISWKSNGDHQRLDGSTIGHRCATMTTTQRRKGKKVWNEQGRETERGQRRRARALIDRAGGRGSVGGGRRRAGAQAWISEVRFGSQQGRLLGDDFTGLTAARTVNRSGLRVTLGGGAVITCNYM
jgi:hypothetical protein